MAAFRPYMAGFRPYMTGLGHMHFFLYLQIFDQYLTHLAKSQAFLDIVGIEKKLSKATVVYRRLYTYRALKLAIEGYIGPF